MVLPDDSFKSTEYFHFLLEPTSIKNFENGSSKPTYSHDLNLLQLAESAIQKGIHVEFSPYDRQELRYAVQQAWPEIRMFNDQELIQHKSNPTFVFSANHLGFVNRTRDKFGPKNVLIQAAIHAFEQPSVFYPDGTASFINTFRNVIDFVITQNDRMADLLFSTLALVAGFQDKERILVSKLVPEAKGGEGSSNDKARARFELGIDPNAVVILNAGGAWKWTQFNEFLRAFISVAKDQPHGKLIFIQPALGQEQNAEHASYHKETLKIIDSLPQSEKSNLIIGLDWLEAGQQMDSYLTAADFGLNINRDSLEQWQSYRVRVLEYISKSLPVIMSRGSFWDDYQSSDAFVFTGHTQFEFEKTLRDLINEKDQPKGLNDRRKVAIAQLRDELVLERQAGRVLDSLIHHELRNQTPKYSSAVLWDYRKSGPRSTFTITRIVSRMYFGIVNNTFAHSVLVAFGLRKVVRKIRKLKG